ncbi:cellulase [Xanthomonas sp.]|uniref:cellulase n=1 Tax=Xanthomonas sp. TaxID=29446 RepID=UPI001F136193|nr:cellulase [Xanthomonas sp.]
MRAPRRAHGAARGALWALASVLLAALLVLPAAAVEQVPYRWRNVAIGGGGFVSGLLFHPAQQGLVYARTDVGGAYRWDAASARWTALTDWLGAADENLMGIDGFAIDPRDPQALYLAAGTYTHERAGHAAILRSHDQGRSFARTDLPFKLGGNELGRGNGERLAVDPNDGRVLLLGSRDAGLWRSDDRGEHWQPVRAFPAVASGASASAVNHAGRRQQVGIVFVVFDPASAERGKASQRIYAGVSTVAQSLFVSEDGGRSWQPLPGQPTGLRPSRMARSGDGIYYLSYGDEPGPDLMANGAVWKYEPAAARWTDITPVPQPDAGPGFGWGAVAVDPRRPDTLIASTFRRYRPSDDIYRSTDGGRSWAPLFPRSRFDHDAAPWTAQARPHWMASLAIDPFDSDRALFVTGYGIWASRNLRAFDAGGQVQWWFADAGLEETVPLDLLSPAQGAPLLSALGDIDGFRHDALDRAQSQFAGPRLTNGESIDAAGQAPQLVVRSGTVRDRRHGEIRAAWSRDGGTSWSAFASEPPAGEGAGHIAINADGSRVIWSPQRGGAWASDDWGRHWQRVQGLADTVLIEADRVDPRRWYGVDAASGRFYFSDDGGRQFRDSGVDVGVPARAERSRPQLRPDPARAGVVYLASPSHGVMRWANGGLSVLAKVQEARSLGLGRAPRDGAAPMLFLAGSVDGVSGVFRSEDEGRRWQRIDDDAHRFGRPYAVTGDPRRVGRVYFATGGRGIVYGDAE